MISEKIKLRKLSRILDEYSKYFGKFTKGYAEIATEKDKEDNLIEDENEYFIVKFDNHVIKPVKTKLIPIEDLDEEINRYRARLKYKQENKEMILE